MLRRELSADFNIISIDLPDHGKSQHSTQFSFEQYAESIIYLLNELSISKANIVGHSLGGKVAMQIALMNESLVDCLVVLDIAPVTYTPRHENVFNALLSVNLEQITDRKEANDIMAEYVAEPSVRQFLLKSLYQDNKTQSWHWRFNLNLLYRDYSLLSKALEIGHSNDKPVLFLKGELSDYLQPQYTKQTIALFPNSRVRVIQGVGHWLHAEKPAECAKHIRTFLRN